MDEWYFVCDMPRLFEGRDVCIWVARLIFALVCMISLNYVGIWLVHKKCDISLCVQMSWTSGAIWLTWLVYMRDVTCAYGLHDLFVCVDILEDLYFVRGMACLFEGRDVCIYGLHDLFWCAKGMDDLVCKTYGWLVLCAWRDSSMCVAWLIFVRRLALLHTKMSCLVCNNASHIAQTWAWLIFVVRCEFFRCVTWLIYVSLVYICMYVYMYIYIHI